GDDVLRTQRDVLHSWAVVALEILVDLALAQPVGGFVERHDDVPPVPYDGRDERGVLGANLALVEGQELREAERVPAAGDPVVEPAALDVADDVIDRAKSHRRTDLRIGKTFVGVARLQSGAPVPRAIHERVHGVAVRSDLRQVELAVGIGLGPGLADGAGAGRGRPGRGPARGAVG